MDYNSLPPKFQIRLAELEKEYKDGELTKKGLEKKKNSLFEEYRQYIDGERDNSGMESAPLSDLLGIGELSLSTSPGIEDEGVSPTNSISSGNYYIQQD